MSLTSPEEEEPRRGGRVRRQVEKFDASTGLGKKGKGRQGAGEEDDEEDEIDEEDSDQEEPTPTKKRPRQSNGALSAAKKTRTPVGAGASRKRTKKAAAPVSREAHDAEAVDGVKADSALFNALQSADIALQPLIDEWVQTYQEAAGDEVSEQASIFELVVLFIRCCGLSSDIEQAEATDDDGIPDVVERIQDESIRVALAAYPLISRTKNFRAFRNNLNLFLSHLIDSLSLTPILFHNTENTPHYTLLVPLLLNWLNCMSSSPLRPIRHTATYMGLKINSALCDVAAEVSKDLSLKQRQREAEIKKGGSTAAAQKRLKDVEAKVKEAQDRKGRLEEMLEEVFDVMFVHRVRDADPAIRTDCLRELGVWAKKYPEYYVSTSYLTYFTRGCNDLNNHARLETARALANLYTKESFVNNARTVTMRLAPRLVEMALRDVDLSVRVTAISVITLIDKTGILQDEEESQRDKVARLIFDQEPRVRKAVGGFVTNLWEERKESHKTEWSSLRPQKKKRAGKISEDDMSSSLDWKALASLLVEISRSLDEPSDPSSSSQSALLSTSSSGSFTRAVAAVESISAEHELWKDWEKLVDYLLLDHSTSKEDMWLLTEDEETFMLQVLIACIQKDDQDEDQEDRTKILMKVLPRLFAKHQGDVNRIAGILSIPQHMNLSLYVDMRMGPAYDSLWDDITKQFLQHTDTTVLTAAIQAINHLTNNAAMAAANTTKLAEMQETLFASLRDTIGNQDVSLLTPAEDQSAQLEAIMLRISLLERSRDLVEVMEDGEGGQSSGWEIVRAFADRGKLGYKEEAKMVESAVQIVFLHMTWLFKRFTAEDAQDEGKVTMLKEKLEQAVEVVYNLTLGENVNTVDTVRRQSFIVFTNLHVLFSAHTGTAASAAKACALTMEDDVQHRLGGAFQAAIEKYASSLPVPEECEDAAGDTAKHPDTLRSTDRAQEEFIFLQLVSVFVGAIRCGVIEVEHAKEPLAHYGRFGSTYDAIVKKLVDVLRDEGIYNKEADTVQHVAGTALQQSFDIFLDGEIDEPSAPIALAKLISTAFVIHGNHFSILRQIHPADVCDFHIAALDYVSRRVTHYVKQEKTSNFRNQRLRLQKKRFAALSYFKALILLLGPVTGKDALKIKNHLDDAIESTGAEATVNKGWDAYRAYEKRLVAIASKDPNVKMAATKKVVETEGEEEDEHDDARNRTPTRVVGRPRSNTITREANHGENGNGRANVNGDRSLPLSPPPTDDREEEEEEEEEVIVVEEEPVVAGQKRAREDEVDQTIQFSSPPPEGDEMDLDLDLELDMDFPDVVPSQRERSASAEPTVKRRKTVKRY